jgi:hypothetical protein
LVGQGDKVVSAHLHLFGRDGPYFVCKVGLGPLCVSDFAGALGKHGQQLQADAGGCLTVELCDFAH